MRGVSKVSYYQDVKDPNITIDEVKTRLERVCEILDTNLPETIIFKESWGAFTAPGLKDNGRTIILYKSHEDSIINWQICNLYRPLATRKSPRWIVRHFNSIMLIPIMFFFVNYIAFFYLLPPVFDTGVAYTFILLQIPYSGVGLYLKKASKEAMKIWKEAMRQAGLWPDVRGSNFEKLFVKFPFVMVLGYAFFALIFSMEIIF